MQTFTKSQFCLFLVFLLFLIFSEAQNAQDQPLAIVNFTGHYREYNASNFGPFLEAIGLDVFRRTVALQLTTEFYVTQSANSTYTLRTTTVFSDSSFSFRSGEQFDQMRDDLGKTVPTVILVRGNRWLLYQESDPLVRAVREFRDDRVRLLMKAKDVMAVKWFRRLPV